MCAHVSARGYLHAVDPRSVFTRIAEQLCSLPAVAVIRRGEPFNFFRSHADDFFPRLFGPAVTDGTTMAPIISAKRITFRISCLLSQRHSANLSADNENRAQHYRLERPGELSSLPGRALK